MKLSINLQDPKYCNGCPCLIKECMKMGKCCFGFTVEYSKTKTGQRVRFKDNAPLIVRPQICKDKNGE